jgi:uncharacterized protein YbjT (DUF2867 family)
VEVDAMSGDSVLVCGATGFVGSQIVLGLAGAAAQTRALVRPTADASALDNQAIGVVRGDFRDPASLEAAVEGVKTIVSTVGVITRQLQGERTLRFDDVEVKGYAALIAAAERAGVERFVFISTGDAMLATRTPFADAKRATEARLAASPIREVIIRPEMNQELWFSPALGFDIEHDTIRILGRGRTRINYVAETDVAAAAIALALVPDPPRLVHLAGPDGVSRVEAADMLSAAVGRPMKRRHLPHLALQLGSRLLTRPNPALASVMGMGLAMDSADSSVGPEGFAALGITPRSVRSYLQQSAEASRGAEITTAPATQA